jgi:hypothetical protein
MPYRGLRLSVSMVRLVKVNICAVVIDGRC